MMKRIQTGVEQKEWAKGKGISWAERLIDVVKIQVMVEAMQYQHGNERGSHIILGSQRSHCNSVV